MGLFDEIKIFQCCPYCKRYQYFNAQTKDLDDAMWDFEALPDDWFNKIKKKTLFGIDRNKMPVFKVTPYDKSAKVWKSQGEKMEAMARVPDEFKNLKYVEVTADCHSKICQEWADKRDIIRQGIPSGFGRMFEGKIKIKKGYLIGDIYDIELVDKILPRKTNERRKKNKGIRKKSR